MSIPTDTPLVLDAWTPARFGHFDAREWTDFLESVRQAGLTPWVDTASIYVQGEAETRLAEALRQSQPNAGLFISTKVGLKREGARIRPDARPSVIQEQVRRSCDRLNRSTLDLVQLHWPDEDVPLQDSCEALAELQREGLVEKFGVVNPSGTRLKRTLDAVEFDSLQLPWNPLESPPEDLQSVARQEDITAIAYDPFCGGLFTEAYADAEPDLADGAIKRHHSQFVRDYRRAVTGLRNLIRGMNNRPSPLPLKAHVLGWLLDQPGVDAVRVGVRSFEELEPLLKVLSSDGPALEPIDDSNPLKQLSGQPRFVMPPPMLPRHNFERHVLEPGYQWTPS